MSEFPKFIISEETVGSIQFREMESGVEYLIIHQPFRDRIVTFIPASDYAPVKVDFLPNNEEPNMADIRELPLWETGLTEHDLAALLHKNKIVPFVSHDILAPIAIPKPGPKEAEQPDPTDPRTHITDYYEKGVPKIRGSRRKTE